MTKIKTQGRPGWRGVVALPLAFSSVAMAAAAAPEDAPQTLEQVVVRGTSDKPSPTLTDIDPANSRPQSTLTSEAIRQVAPLTSDFGSLANLLPSFASSAPNGNGFDAAKGLTLRGFPDGQFNILLDGIPFADPDGFTHHSTSIFPVSSIESLAVDRSPGGGTSVGYATIGGSLDIRSLAIPAAAGGQVYGAYGSFSTSLYGVRLNTASPKQDGETGLLVNVQHLQTAGALANNDGRRNDLLLKSESRFAGLRLTLLYSYDDYHFINPPSVTTDQLAQSGSGVGLGTTPGTPLYNEYAKTDRSADFGYARLQGDLVDGLDFEETIYTYSYRNRGLSVNGDVTLPSSYQVGAGFGLNPDDIAGRLSANRYRTVGNILRVSRPFGNHILRAGLWLEHSHQISSRNALDLTTDAFYNANKAGMTSALFDYDASLDTVQPSVEDEWKATPELTLKTGLRYQRVKRGFEAAVVPNSRPGTDGEVSHDVHALLPSIEGNYAFAPQFHGFLQWSKGALTPNQSFFYTSNAQVGNQARPETSKALQGGFIYAARGIDFTADAYVVDLKDYVSTTTDANKNTLYVNSGRVRYKGIEAEADIAVGHGFTLVGNGSLIRAQFRDAGLVSAKQKAGDTIPSAPSFTALLGALYRSGPYAGSLLTKFIGTEYQGAGGSSDGTDRRVPSYSYTNLTLSRSLDELTGKLHAVVSLQVNNLENHTPITDSGGRSAVGPTGPLLVNVLPRRNYMVSFSCEL